MALRYTKNTLKWLCSLLIYDPTDKCVGIFPPIILFYLLLYAAICLAEHFVLFLIVLILSFLALLLPVLQLLRWKRIHLPHKIIGILCLIPNLMICISMVSFFFFRD